VEPNTLIFESQLRGVADQVVFLMTINHVWTKARLRIAREHGFGLYWWIRLDRFLRADFSLVLCITSEAGPGLQTSLCGDLLCNVLNDFMEIFCV
jgi:hypothetical protein